MSFAASFAGSRVWRWFIGTKPGNYLDARIAWRKTFWVVVCILATAVLAYGAGLLVGDNKQLLVAGAIVAAIGKLSEIAATTSDIKKAGKQVKDGFALFGEGATFFGLLITVLGAVFALDV